MTVEAIIAFGVIMIVVGVLLIGFTLHWLIFG